MPLLMYCHTEKMEDKSNFFHGFRVLGPYIFVHILTDAEQMITFSSFTSKSGLKQNTEEKKRNAR